MIFWFFGYPGIGKDYIAENFGKRFSIPYVDVDGFLTGKEREKLIAGTFTAGDRIKKLKRVASYLETIGRNAAVADSLPDDKSRKFLARYFKNNIVFIIVTASRETHRKRILSRKSHFFTSNMLDAYIKKHWHPTDNLPHFTFKNENLNAKEIEKKLLKIYKASAL